MRARLPLSALRAFECAARHLSIARAAEELCVTPTAVSHQIRSLEEFLATTLFERNKGRLSLTRAAAIALDGLSDGFDKIEAAISPLHRRCAIGKIRVAASPSVVSQWLLPRLHRFTREEPETEVALISRPDLRATKGNSIDICITSTEMSGTKSDLLMDERIFPVCAPGLMADLPSDDLANLAQLALIHNDDADEPSPSWRRYLEEVRAPLHDGRRDLRFDESYLALEAALNGHGVLLARGRLVSNAITSGRLVALSVPPFSQPGRYYVAHTARPASQPSRRFMDWLNREARAESVNATRSSSLRSLGLQA